jgi:hypothetical protein
MLSSFTPHYRPTIDMRLARSKVAMMTTSFFTRRNRTGNNISSRFRGPTALMNSAYYTPIELPV